MNESNNPPETSTVAMPKYKHPLTKSIAYGFVWALIFAMFLPLGTIQFWQYSFFVGAVPSTLIWDTFNIQNNLSVVLVALANTLVLLIPYFYYLKTKQQHWWLYLSFSLYGFINAALGFTIIISVKGLAH